MPLLLKFKKDRVKSFQFGGVTNFYTTYTVKEAQQPKYNPGALLEAYSPMKKMVEEASKPKEIKIPEFKTQIGGHTNDTELASEILNKEMDTYFNMIRANRSDLELKQQEAKMNSLQNLYAVANKNSYDNTQKTKDEVLSSSKNDAAGSNIYISNGFNDFDGKFWVTEVKKNQDGSVTQEDKAVSAADYYENLYTVEKLQKENKLKDLDKFYTKINYQTGFQNRDTDKNFAASKGNNFVNEILSLGYSPDKAINDFGSKFQQLGGEEKSKTVANLEKSDNVTKASSTTDTEADNINQLMEVSETLQKTIDIKQQNALMSRAYESIKGSELDKIFSSNKTQEEKHLELRNLAVKKYLDIIGHTVGAKRKIKEIDKDAQRKLEDVKKAFAFGGGSDKKLFDLSGHVADALVGENSQQDFLETVGLGSDNDIRNRENLITDVNKSISGNVMVSATKSLIHKDKEITTPETSKINKTIAGKIKVNNAENAKRIIKEKYNKIVEFNADTKNKDKEKLFTVNDLTSEGEDKSGFPNLDKAMTADGVNISKYNHEIAIDINKSPKITFLPVKIKEGTNKEFQSVEQTIFSLPKDQQEDFQKFLENYQLNYDKLRKKLVEEKTISELDFTKELQKLTSKYDQKFKEWSVMPFWSIPVLVNDRIFETNPKVKESIIGTSSSELTDDEETSYTGLGEKDPITIWFNQITETFSTDVIRKSNVFIPMSNNVMLNFLSKPAQTDVKTTVGEVSELKEESLSKGKTMTFGN